MSGRVQWKKFAFFDKDTVNENLAGTLDAQLTCACADNGLLLFGDSSGFISLSDRNLHLSWKHKAFRGPVKGVAYVESQRRQYVIAAGDEYSPPEASSNTLGPVSSAEAELPDGAAVTASSPSRFAVKIFQASDMSRPLQAFLVTQSCVQGHVLTAFSVNSDCTLISVGFSNGALMLYGGHFLQDHSLGPRAPPAPIVLFPSHQAPISALHFCELYMLPAARSGGSALRQIRLFAVLDTEATNRSSQLSEPGGASGMGGIFVFDTSMADREAAVGAATPQPVSLPRLGVPRMLDERGASAQCSSIMQDTAELVIGREEGVFLYSVDDRGGAAGFEGEKQCVSAVGRYILVGSMDTKTRRVLVTIYDLRNKFISMSHLLAPGDNVKMVLHDGGVAYVVTTAGTLIRFREKDTLCKVDVLLKKSLHALAISLAAEEQAPVAEVMKLYKQYGDHLFRRGDHEAAVQQYCHTIGFVPASYVIRRFLDSQRIGHLTSYLETLHSKGFASKDLTTLLLTCYTKTRDVDRLDAFISQGEHDLLSNHQDDSPSMNKDEEGTLLGGMDAASRKFDIASAIATLRHAGYTAHAMKLALKYGDHVGYLSMLLYPSESDHIDAFGQETSGTGGPEGPKEGEAVLDAGAAAFGHIVGIVEEVVYSVKKDLDNGYKFTTTASSQAAHYMTRRMSNGSSMRITESTNAKLDALLALLKKHGRRILHLKPDATTGLLIMLFTGVPLGVVKETRDSTADEIEGDNVATNSIDIKELLYAVTSQTAPASTDVCTTGPSTIHVSSYSDPLYCVEDLVPVFIDDFDATGKAGIQKAQGWHQRYLTAFLEGSVLALSGNPAGSPPLTSSGQSETRGVGAGGVVVNMKGGRRNKLSSQMTGLLLELYLDQYDKLKRSSVASSTAKVNGIPLLSEHQRKVAITQLEAKVMNMLDGTVAADYDTGHALLLVHSFNFLPGMLYLLEKSQSVDVILGQLREKKDYPGIFRILRREGSKNPDLMLQQLEYFVLDSVEFQQQRVAKHQNKVVATKKGGNTPQAVLQQVEDSDDEYQSSHGVSSAASESSSDDESAGSDGDIFDNVETMLDILEPEIMYAGSVSAGEHHHGHVCISQVLKTLALNPALPLHVPLELIKNSLRGASNGLHKLEKDTYKMRISINALLNKSDTQKTGAKTSSGPKDKSAGNPFGNSDSEDESYGAGGKAGVMVGYSEGDENGDEDYEHMVQQAELAREKQHWDGIKKAQMEKVNDHEGFYAELDASPDGYATVASFFCKKPIMS